MSKIEEAQEILKTLGLPTAQQNEMSAFSIPELRLSACTGLPIFGRYAADASLHRNYLSSYALFCLVFKLTLFNNYCCLGD